MRLLPPGTGVCRREKRRKCHWRKVTGKWERGEEEKQRRKEPHKALV